MNITPAQRRFTGGEISPLLHEQHDIESHGNSLALLKNMVADPRGPAVTRPTTKFYRQINSVTDARVITWQVSADKYVILLIRDLVINVYIRTAGTLTDNTPATFATPWTAADIHDIHVVPDPNNTTLTMFHPGYQPRVATWNGTNITGITTGAYTATPWTTNYPETGLIHDQRLVALRDANVWATKPGARTDFTLGAGTLADAIAVEIDENISIKWAASADDMVIGTSKSEHLTTSVGANIYAGDIRIRKHSQVGGKNIQPQMLDDLLTYVGAAGKKLFGTEYDRDVQRWVPQELTFHAEHITQNGIKSYAWGPHPNYLCYFGMEDFDFRIMTFNKALSISAWSQHETQGDVKSLAVGEINGQAECVMAVVRPRQGTNIFLEITENEYALDAYTVEDHTGTPVTSLTGLTQYNGTTVSVITDGAVHPDVAVTGGNVPLDYPAEVIAVGYSFLQHMTTLPRDDGSNRGSARSYVKRFKDIYVGLKDSQVPKINGVYPPDRAVSAPMGSISTPVTDLVKVQNLDWDLDEPIDIEQPLPLKLEVTGIYGELKQSKM